MKLDEIVIRRKNKTIYRDGENCIKVFDEDYSKADVLNEALNNARIENIGLCTPKIKEVMMVDGKWAIVTDFIEGKTLEELMLEHPEKIDEYHCEVDYIITHEPPSLVKSTMLVRGDADEVNKLNGYLEQLNRACKFKHWYFGSMHEDKQVTPVHTAVFRNLIPLK